MCDTFVHLFFFLYSESQTSYLWDNFAFQPFQYIRERLLCLARLLTPNFFRKYLFTQSACDRGEKLRGKWHRKSFQRRTGNDRQIKISNKLRYSLNLITTRDMAQNLFDIS